MAHLIDKDALIAEINRQHKILMQTDHTYGAQFVLGFRQACRQIIDFLDTLEVKEVDLVKEIQTFSMELAMKENNGDWEKDIRTTAKHFFELGLKAQKGE